MTMPYNNQPLLGGPMFDNRMAPIKTICVEELMYIPVGEYKPMYTRPYTACVQQSALENIVDGILHASSSVVGARDMAGLNKSLIYPSAVPLTSAINNNWVSERRYIFILKVTITDNFNMMHRYYMQGYTDHNGITNQGTANPAMIHTVNTVIETSINTYQTPFGQVQKEKLQKVYNVISNNENGFNCYLQRPSDIYYNMEMTSVNNGLNSLTDFKGIGTSLDTRYTISATDVVNKTSEVVNNIPSQYAANIINNGLRSQAKLDFQQSFDEQALATEAINRVNDPDIKNNKFLKYLSMQNGSRRYGIFSFHELFCVDQTINDRFKLLNITKDIVDISQLNSPTVGETWHGQDAATLMAYSVIEASVGIATKFGFSKMNFTASNQLDATGQPYVVVTYYASILNLDPLESNQLVDMFKVAFMDSVFLDESRNNAIPLSFHVYVDILGTSKVSVIDQSGYEIWYTIPTFANSAFTPIITTDKANLDHLSDSVTSIINYVSSGTQRRNY